MLKPTDGSGEKLKLWMFNAPDPSSRTVTPMDASENGATIAEDGSSAGSGNGNPLRLISPSPASDSS
eukprot:6949-Pelagococcus_subviridis.AAC.1